MASSRVSPLRSNDLPSAAQSMGHDTFSSPESSSPRYLTQSPEANNTSASTPKSTSRLAQHPRNSISTYLATPQSLFQQSDRTRTRRLPSDPQPAIPLKIPSPIPRESRLNTQRPKSGKTEQMQTAPTRNPLPSPPSTDPSETDARHINGRAEESSVSFRGSSSHQRPTNIANSNAIDPDESPPTREVALRPFDCTDPFNSRPVTNLLMSITPMTPPCTTKAKAPSIPTSAKLNNGDALSSSTTSSQTQKQNPSYNFPPAQPRSQNTYPPERLLRRLRMAASPKSSSQENSTNNEKQIRNTASNTQMQLTVQSQKLSSTNQTQITSQPKPQNPATSYPQSITLPVTTSSSNTNTSTLTSTAPAPAPTSAITSRSIPASNPDGLMDTPKRRSRQKSYVSNLYNSPDPFVFYLAGPILLTAPHGLRLIRGGEKGERRRIHKRERWVNELVVRVAKRLEEQYGFMVSFMLWNLNTARKADSTNLDPNYLTRAQFAQSPWHHVLVQFKKRFPHFPIMHIDVHGKMDRKTNLDLDLGMEPMHQFWPHKKTVDSLRSQLADGFRIAFHGVKPPLPPEDTREFGVEEDPYLCGFWGLNSFYTMTHQAVMSGIPSAQLEIPYTLRNTLCTDPAVLAGFAEAIYGAYRNGILPLHPDRTITDAVTMSRQMSHVSNCPKSSLFQLTVAEMVLDLERMDKACDEKCI